ncbi:MAG: beta-ACP synthase [Paludibacteraceae bacterium]|nr:beta-ACP synthase [Paludibacteraceae bacterium]
MENRIVYVAGDNVVTSLGLTTAENVENILAEQTGIKYYEDGAIYPEPFMASRIDDATLASHPLWKELSNYHRLEKMMIISAADAINRSGVDASSSRTAFVFSSTKGNIDLLANSSQLNRDAELMEMALRVARFFHSDNRPYVISNACISGVLAVMLGQRLLKSGLYDNVVLIGGDTITEFVVSGFMSFKSVSPNPCKPYDKNRDGLSMGEGAATMVLTVDKSLVKDARPVMVAGGASSNDANHISGPSRTGYELNLAIRSAMDDAELTPEQIDLVDMHGTATVYNDEMESKALDLAGLADRPLLSLKGYFGHTLGASGLIESVLCVESMRRQMQYRTLGYSELGVPVQVNVTTETKPAQLNNILKTASGFGGCNAAVVFSTENKGSRQYATGRGKITHECVVSGKKIEVDGKVVFDGSSAEDYATFIRSAFKAISEPYMKFSKMDDLCKLGVTAVEYLLQNDDLHSRYKEEEVSMLLANRFSSLETDCNHQRIIDDREFYQPSPAVFVYTLANIVMGEICIRRKFKGENLFIIDSELNKERMLELASFSLTTGTAKAVITGWVDFFGEEYSAHIYLVEDL